MPEILPPSQPLPNDPGLQPDQTFQQLEAQPDNRVLQRFDTLEAAKGNQTYALSAVQGPELVFLYRPGMPIRMVSALDPTALKDGEFSLLQNIRPDADVMTTRYPTTLFGSTSTKFGTFTGGAAAGLTACRGVWSGGLSNGTTTTEYILASYFDGTAVRIYYSTNGTQFYEATQSSGAYGTTRMTDTGANVAFLSQTNPRDGTDYVIISNGSTTSVAGTSAASPIIFGPTLKNGSYCRPHAAVTAPTAASGCNAQPYVYPWLNMTATPGTFSNDGSGHMTLSTASGLTTLAITTAVATGNDATLTTSGHTSLTNSPQICIATDQFSSCVWASLRVDAYCATTSAWITLWDPSNPNSFTTPVVVPWTGATLNTTGAQVMCFDTSQISGSDRVYGGLRFTWTSAGPNPAANTTIRLLAIFGSGNWTWNNAFTVSNYNSGSLAESAGVTLAANASGIGGASIGAASTYGDYALPETGILVDYLVPIPNISSAQVALGVDTQNIYMQPYGSSTAFLIASESAASYSAGWTANNANPTNSYGINGNFTLSNQFYAPSAYSIPVPAGACMCAGGGRVFVGQGSNYYVSEYALPFRFRLILDIENNQPRPSSGTFVNLPNTEKAVAWAVTGASGLGTNTFYLFTGQSTYCIQGIDGLSLSQPTLLASVGCSAAGSVSVYKDAIFFLDDNLQIRRFAYGRSQLYLYENANAYELMVPISKRVVDDQTRNIPASRIAFAQGQAAYDRYYFAFSSGSEDSNLNMLVWDETIGSFVKDTFPGSATCEAMCATQVTGSKKLLIQSADLYAYDYENTSGTTASPVIVTSRSMNDQGWGPTFFGRIGVLADVQSVTTMNVTKTLIAGSAATDSSSIDMSTNATSQILRWDSNGSAPAGQHGVACQISLSATLSPGARIFTIVNEQMPAGILADAL